MFNLLPSIFGYICDLFRLFVYLVFVFCKGAAATEFYTASLPDHLPVTS